MSQSTEAQYRALCRQRARGYMSGFGKVAKATMSSYSLQARRSGKGPRRPALPLTQTTLALTFKHFASVASIGRAPHS